jgi:hypothetical protein
MAEPIGSLRVELSAGWAQLEKSFAKARKQTKSLGKTLEGLDRPLTKLAKNAGAAFAVVGAGAAAAAAGVVALGSRGAQVADVASAFDALSESAGESADVMLGALREGVKSTLSDFDLMKVANKALGAELLKTAADAKTMAAGARLLAKRTGGDTAQAFETLTTAIASGRTAQLKQLGLFVDSKQAAEDYAAAQGKTIAQLNDADRAAALQAATLAALRTELRENAPAAADFGEKIEQVKVELQNAFDAFAVLISELPSMATLLDGLAGLFRSLTREVEGSRSIIIDLVNNGVVLFARSLVAAADAAQSANDTFDSLRLTWLSAKKIALELAWAEHQLHRGFLMATPALKNNRLQVEAWIAQIEREIEATARQADALVKGNAAKTDAIQQTRRELEKLAKDVEAAAKEERSATIITRELTTGVKEFGAAVKTAGEASKAWAKILKTENALALQLMKDELAEFKEAEDEAREVADQLADETRAAFEGMRTEVEELNDEAKRLKDAKLEGLFVGLALVAGTFNDQLEETVLIIGNMQQAFRDAKTDTEKFYAILAAIGQIGGQIGGKVGGFLQGAAGGASVGAMFGPWGAAIGGAIGGIASLFGQAGDSVNDLRDAFFDAHGGWLALQRELATATTEDLVAQVFDADTVDEFNAAVQRVKDTLDVQGQAQRALQEAIERYGFTIEQLGPAMQRQELDKQAVQLLQDFRLLTASGIDVNTVIEKMGPNLLDFVKTSIAAGQAIPAAMKPMIDELIRSGQLVDENGEAFESAEDAGITFTETLTEGLSRAVDAIERLVAALTGVPPVTIPVTVDYRERNRPDVPGVPEFHHGGVGNFGAGTLAMLHGREAIMPLDGAASGLGSDPAVLEELRAIRRGQEDQPRAVGRAVRDSMAFGTR